MEEKETMLNRERENIATATVEVNNVINETQAREVNNQYKIEKKSYKNKFMILFLLIMACFIAAFAYVAAYKFINYDENKPEVTKQVNNPKEKIIAYIKKDKVRKFQVDKTINYQGKVYDKLILLLAPKTINSNYYLMLLFNESDIFNEVGTYNILEDNVTLSSKNNTTRKFIIDEKGLYSVDFTSTLKIMDTEMKYYEYKDNNVKELLIINGTLKGECALFIGANNNYEVGSFSETAESITLYNGRIFVKDNLNIINNSHTYVLIP